jgi:hypothetical protein
LVLLGWDDFVKASKQQNGRAMIVLHLILCRLQLRAYGFLAIISAPTKIALLLLSQYSALSSYRSVCTQRFHNISSYKGLLINNFAFCLGHKVYATFRGLLGKMIFINDKTVHRPIDFGSHPVSELLGGLYFIPTPDADYIVQIRCFCHFKESRRTKQYDFSRLADLEYFSQGPLHQSILILSS